MGMVERVAKAIFEAEYGTEDQHGNPMAPGPGENELMLTLARAAIAAMREPTADMIERGYSSRERPPGEVWRAMIDEALQN